MNFMSIFNQKPKAFASLRGSNRFPKINGVVYFFEIKEGIVVVTNVSGLPDIQNGFKSPVFAFHIHSGTSCSGNQTDYFANTKNHYNPQNNPHPYHAGDMPPLFGCNGSAFSAFLTNRFTIKEIIGKTVVIHYNNDDFKTQPSGNSGEKIACGEIKIHP